jgi:hypothetical protein
MNYEGENKMSEPLKEKISFDEMFGASIHYFDYEDIKSAVEGLIKFHEDRIEELIQTLIEKSERFKDEPFPTWIETEKIIKEYESIMAIEHWLEDVI